MKIFYSIFVLYSVNLLKVDAQAAPKKVICYLQQGHPSFDKLNASICTHFIYVFMGAASNGSVISLLPGVDYGTNGYLAKFKNLKVQNPSVKLLVSFGGNVTVLEQIASSFYRYYFAYYVWQFLIANNFDGIDLNWQYSTSTDKNNLVYLLSALRSQLYSYGKLISISVSPEQTRASETYNIPQIVQQVDFINFLIWSYHGGWESTTNYDSPLYGSSNDPSPYYIAGFVNYWLTNGAPSRMLNIGIQCYGSTWTLANANNNGLFAPATGQGVGGPITQAPGLLYYNEICPGLVSQKYTIKFDPTRGATYAYGGNQWIAYRGTQAVDAIVSFVIANNLGGVNFWSLDQEDYNNTCGSGAFPLVSRAFETLGVCDNSDICSKAGFQNIGTFVGNYSNKVYKKSYYLPLYLNQSTWQEAAATCVAFNMTLATFKTAQEFQYVQAYLLNYWNLLGEWLHIGGLARIPKSTTDWYWIDSNAPVNFTMTWAPNNPNYTSNDWCLSLGPKSANKLLFNDINCYWIAPFLCQKSF